MLVVSQRLGIRGWRRTTDNTVQFLEQYTPLALWQKDVLPGQSATAFLYPLPVQNGHGTGMWQLEAVAEPPGFAFPGC